MCLLMNFSYRNKRAISLRLVRNLAVLRNIQAALLLGGRDADAERGRFRAFLLTSFRRFMGNERNRDRAAKRGGGEYNVSLSEADRLGQQPAMNLLLLDDALQKLASFKPQHSRVVELRFFGGLTIAETAAVLGISHATVERDWNFARAWLHQQVSQ